MFTSFAHFQTRLSSRSSLYSGCQSFAVYIFANFSPRCDLPISFLFWFFFSINFFFPPTLLYFIYKKIFLTCIHTYIYLFIYFWLHWVFITALGLSLVVENGGYSLAVVHRLLIMVASLVAEYRP